jgi:threonine dehydratase
MLGVTVGDVVEAGRRIGAHVRRTPLERSAALSEQLGADLWLKLECQQRTGSFKLRGALNALLSLPPDVRQRGVATASAGNHGLGVAEAARLVGAPATVVVAETASSAKIDALRRSGATLVLHGATYDAAERHARDLAREQGLHFVSPYNDPAVVAGGGTVALEICEDLPGLDVLVVPAGGGGLLSGIGVAVRALRPRVALYGAQAAAAPGLHAALAAGRPTHVPIGETLADGLAGNVEAGSITVPLLQQLVDRLELVDESAIARAMRTLVETDHLLVEGSAAVPLAALQTGLFDVAGKRVVLVLTGRNVALETVRHVLADGS